MTDAPVQTSQPAGVAPGGGQGPGRPPAPPNVLLAPVGRNYWQIVWRQFRRSWLAMTGLFMVVALFLLAVFAPFLANKYPYYWRSAADGLTFPLFKCLSNDDLLHLIAFGLFLLIPLTRRLLRGTGWRFWALNDLRRAVVMNLAVFLVAAGLLAALRHVPDRVFERREVEVGGKTTAVYVERSFREELARGAQADYWSPPVPFSPAETQVGDLNEGPSPTHLLGTDRLGRSVAARLIYGARVGLAVGFIAVGISVAIGLLVGGVSAYFGGWVDIVLQRFVEIFMCFPGFFLLLLIIAFFGPKLWLIMVAIGLTSWTGVARFIRAEILKIKALDYITAARALGLRPLYIIIRHAVPNGLAPVLVSATFGIAGAITLEAALSFLGLGDPDKPSWGLLLSQGHSVAAEHPLLLLVSGTMIFIAILAYNMVGEGLRDAIDPRLKI